MAYQRGSLKQVSRRLGLTWILRRRVTKPDGRRVENPVVIGLVRDFPNEDAAWREVDRQGVLVQINETEAEPGRIKVQALAEHYLKADFGADAIRPKSVNTKSIVAHLVRDYIIARWGDAIAEDVKPLEVQRWLKALHTDTGLAWPSVAKIRGIMSRIYRIGIIHGLVEKNPVEHVETSQESDYRPIDLTPEQTLRILQNLTSALHHTLILTCAATALRASEILALRWSDVLWLEGRIRVSKRWAKGKDGKTKTDASDGFVPLHPVLAGHLRGWRRQTPHVKETDFVFPSLRDDGKVPLSACTFVKKHLRPAAIAAGVVSHLANVLASTTYVIA